MAAHSGHVPTRFEEILTKEILEIPKTKTTMRQEIIENAAEEYCRKYMKPYFSSDKSTFVSGAEWRINSVWHEAIERPNNGKPFLYVAKYRHTDEEKYDTEYMSEEDSWDGFITEERLKKWAYIDDLLPGRKEGGR